MGLGHIPQPQYLVAVEAHRHPNSGSDGAPVKIMQGVDVKMSVDEGDSALVGASDGQIVGGPKKDSFPLEAVGHRYAMVGNITQVSFVRHKHFPDLDVDLDHQRAN